MNDLGSCNQLRFLLADITLKTNKNFSEHKLRESTGVLKTVLLLQTTNNCDIWDMFKKAEASIWNASKIDLSHDAKDWERMSVIDKSCISRILGLSSVSVYTLTTHLVMDVCCEIRCDQARCYLGSQMANEQVHLDIYSLLYKTFDKNNLDKKAMINLIETEPGFLRKVSWMMKWCNRDICSYADRTLALAIVKGIFFSGSFCSLLWLKERSLMPGLTAALELMSRDVGAHCNFACLLYNKLVEKLSSCVVVEMVQEAVDIECEFVRSVLSLHQLGLSLGPMTQYIQCCANHLLVSLRQDKLYDIQNPYDWMDAISMQGRLSIETNFVQSNKENYQVFNYKDVSPEPALTYSLSLASF